MMVMMDPEMPVTLVFTHWGHRTDTQPNQE